jgi:pimeloyl-ACP methyl ester carboxylesterase
MKTGEKFVGRIIKGLLALLILIAIALGVWGYAPDGDPAALRAKYANASSQFLDLGGGLTVHVRDEGPRDAPVLVLLHGSNASLHTWEPWVARLKGKYRIISYDHPGHGLTGPHPKNDYSAAAFADVTDRVTAKLGVSRFALAGNSMGGWIAWNYALAHPEKLTALVLVDAGGAPDSTPTALPIGFRIARTPVLRDIMRKITPRSVIAKSVHQSMANQAIINDQMIDRYYDLLLYPGNREATGYRFAMPRLSADPKALAALKMPVLVMWGKEDTLIPVASAHWFAKAIPGAKLIIYPGIGHIPMEEAVDKSAADVDGFLSAIAPLPQK